MGCTQKRSKFSTKNSTNHSHPHRTLPLRPLLSTQPPSPASPYPTTKFKVPIISSTLSTTPHINTNTNYTTPNHHSREGSFSKIFHTTSPLNIMSTKTSNSTDNTPPPPDVFAPGQFDQIFQDLPLWVQKQLLFAWADKLSSDNEAGKDVAIVEMIGDITKLNLQGGLPWKEEKKLSTSLPTLPFSHRLAHLNLSKTGMGNASPLHDLLQNPILQHLETLDLGGCDTTCFHFSTPRTPFQIFTPSISPTTEAYKTSMQHQWSNSPNSKH